MLSLPDVAAHAGPGTRASVFYNPAMVFDRDLNVAVVRAARASGLPLRRGWEMLSATGVRGLRVMVEAGPFERFLFSETSPRAVEVLSRNAARSVGATAVVAVADARHPPKGELFDYVDLDPYGTPLPFLDAAFDALAPGGLLAVTATDTRVLAGVEPGAAERRYGGRPLRGRLAPEAGLRLVLAELARRAASRGAALEPRLAYVGSHHVRAYATLGAPSTALPIAEIDPDRWDGPPIGGPGRVGPLWVGPLFDPRWVEQLRVPEAAADPRAFGRWLDRLTAEVRVDTPFYYESNSLAKLLRLREPPSVEHLAERLGALGYRWAPTHARAGAFRTNAPFAVVAELARGGPDQPQNERVRA